MKILARGVPCISSQACSESFMKLDSAELLLVEERAISNAMPW